MVLLSQPGCTQGVALQPEVAVWGLGRATPWSLANERVKGSVFRSPASAFFPELLQCQPGCYHMAVQLLQPQRWLFANWGQGSEPPLFLALSRQGEDFNLAFVCILFYIFETGLHCVVLAGLEFLCLPYKCWD